MSTAIIPKLGSNRDYPTTDGRPMAETDLHRKLMNDLIQTLEVYYADDQTVYVSGNLLIFYEPGNKRKHLAPDVFMVKGVEKKERLNYLVWEENKAPEVVIELTSSSTRSEDTKKKYKLYQDRLKVREYFLFDPYGDYLWPALQGHRLRAGKYAPIRPRRGRLPSHILGLHLEQDGSQLRLVNPDTDRRLPTPGERVAGVDLLRQRVERAEQQAELYRQGAELAERQAEFYRQQAEAAKQERSQTRDEIVQLHRELDELRRRLGEQ